MFNRRIKASVMSGVVALGLALSGQAMAAFKAEEAAKVEADAKATLAKFEAQTKGADAVLANAKGVLVCPSITRGASSSAMREAHAC
jgi:lipid-binding SYLF domain-containing protein